MANPALSQYMQEVDNAIDGRDGHNIAALVSFKHPHVMDPRLQLERPESHCEKWFLPPWDEFVAAHIKCCWAVAKRDFVEAYGCQSIAVTFIKIFQSQKDENWGLPILFAIILDLRRFATSADIQLCHQGRSKSGSDSLEKAAESLMSCFRVCASDTRAAPDDSKKWGMLNVVNQLFKIYFKINKLHLCKPLIRAIDALPIKEKFSMSQLVTYRYFVGRKAMFDSDFRGAEEFLSFAFQKCHRQAKKNKRMILIYLLPVKMLLGHMPKVELLRRYDLMEFADVAKAVSSGNLLLLNTTLQKFQAFFIKCGVYLILEKLKVITYRNLFKKVALILRTHQLPVNAFTVTLTMMGEDDVDDDEVECILANLIYENKIKGYISHQHKKVVISKQKAFPPLSTVL